jgi:hypothetical protein
MEQLLFFCSRVLNSQGFLEELAVVRYVAMHLGLSSYHTSPLTTDDTSWQERLQTVAGLRQLTYIHGNVDVSPWKSHVFYKGWYGFKPDAGELNSGIPSWFITRHRYIASLCRWTRACSLTTLVRNCLYTEQLVRAAGSVHDHNQLRYGSETRDVWRYLLTEPRCREWQDWLETPCVTFHASRMISNFFDRFCVILFYYICNMELT